MRRTKKTRRRGEAPAPKPTEAAPRSPNLPPGVTSGFVLGATVVVSAVFGAEIWLTGSKTGLPLDDAFLHLNIAENLASGAGFGINPGELLPATTSPLWVLLLAIPGLFGADLLVTAKILSAMSFVALGVTAARLAARMTERTDLAVLAGMGALLAGRLVWSAASGMETLAFTTVSLWALERAVALESASARGREIGLGLLLGCAALLRPEGILLFGVWLACAAIRPEPPRLRLPSLWTLGAFVLLAAPWVVFCLVTTGGPLPPGLTAKLAVVESEPGGLFLVHHLREIFESNPVLGIGYPIGIFLSVRAAMKEPRWRLLALWAVFFPLAEATLLPIAYRHSLYLMPILPVEMLLGAVGIAWVLGKVRLTEASKRPIARIALVVVLVSGGYGATRFAQALAADVTELNDLPRRMGVWIQQKTPPDALIATSDPGALGYQGQRRILDLSGVAAPEIAARLGGRRLGGEQDAALFEVIAREKPAFLVIRPSWYPHLTSRPDLFEPVAMTKTEGPPPAGGVVLVAYRARWDQYTPAPPLDLAQAQRELVAARAALREGRRDETWRRLTELEARGPLDRDWRRLLYVIRAETALERADCREARLALLHLDFLAPSAGFRSRESVETLEARARSCKGS